ncbi:hypothetical protein X739_33495 [Mesorhizobium sp. LNHC220B00]|nr:hypothetical protein X739_33495 [Mesorhizobium sp. LNHC220B00]
MQQLIQQTFVGPGNLGGTPGGGIDRPTRIQPVLGRELCFASIKNPRFRLQLAVPVGARNAPVCWGRA